MYNIVVGGGQQVVWTVIINIIIVNIIIITAIIKPLLSTP